jgi:hypothetical protein
LQKSIVEITPKASVAECQGKNELVGASGFEPEASCAQGRRATRLRYAPTSVGLEFTAVSDFVDVDGEDLTTAKISKALL